MVLLIINCIKTGGIKLKEMDGKVAEKEIGCVVYRYLALYIFQRKNLRGLLPEQCLNNNCCHVVGPFCRTNSIVQHCFNNIVQQ